MNKEFRNDLDKLLGKLDTATAIIYLSTISDARYSIDDRFARIVMFCSDLIDTYEPTDKTVSPWNAVIAKIADMDEHYTDKTDNKDITTAIDVLLDMMTKNQYALLQTLTLKDAPTRDYIHGAVNMYESLETV